MTTLNHTIADATLLLAEKYGFDYKTREAWFDRLQEAAHKGGLVVREPLTGLPYRPVHKRMGDYLMDIVSSEDLNAWLQKNGAEYRLDRPGQEQQGDDEQTQDQKLAPHEYTAEQQALFDPLSQAGIAELFDIAGVEWKKLFDRAKRQDGLDLAREGNIRPHQYNPARVASWLVKRGHLKQAHATNRLANNLPPRSQDSKHLITGELPD